MVRVILTLTFFGLAALSKLSAQQADASSSQGSVTASKSAAGIDATIDDYIAAYNTGDINEVMAFWAEQADFVDIHGSFHEGRDLIAALFRRGFADNPGRTLALNSVSRKQLSTNVVMDDGTLVLTASDGTTTTGRYTVVWTKADGKWLIRSARDIPIEPEISAEATDAKPLEEFAWLVGDWKATSDEHQIDLKCRWSLDESFLVQNYEVRSSDKDFRVVTYIGFDPIEGSFRTWFFDSRGGFGGGVWARIDDVYHMSSTTVMANGMVGTSDMTWEQIDENTARWGSSRRMVGGEPLPDTTQTYQRVLKGVQP